MTTAFAILVGLPRAPLGLKVEDFDCAWFLRAGLLLFLTLPDFYTANVALDLMLIL